VTDSRIVTLREPGRDLEAHFAPGAGMVGCSLRHGGEELLGALGRETMEVEVAGELLRGWE
jgi:hypothetical protein